MCDVDIKRSLESLKETYELYDKLIHNPIEEENGYFKEETFDRDGNSRVTLLLDRLCYDLLLRKSEEVNEHLGNVLRKCNLDPGEKEILEEYTIY